MPPGALGDAPMSLDQALHAVEGATAFLDHVMEAAAAQGSGPNRRRHYKLLP